MEVKFPPILKAATETAEFTKNTENYLRNKSKEGELVGGRIVAWKVLFVTSHKLVDLIMHDNVNFTSKRAYGTFKGLNIFGSVLAFEDGAEHDRLRNLLLKQEYVHNETYLKQVIQSVLTANSHMISKYVKTTYIQVYELMKAISIDILSIIFLGMKLKTLKSTEDQLKADRSIQATNSKPDMSVVDLSKFNFPRYQSTFWKGTVSTGIKMKMSFLGLSSAFSKAEEVKKKLEKFIKTSLNASSTKSSVSPKVSNQKTSKLSDAELIKHHILFSSSMVSKTLASLLTTFFMIVENEKYKSLAIVENILKEQVQSQAQEEGDKKKDIYLESVIKELLRLYPPIIGSCRITEKDILLDKYKIKKNTLLWCSFLSSQKDEKVFLKPNDFIPERWFKEGYSSASSSNSGSTSTTLPNIFSLGSGDRYCLGEKLVWNVIKMTILHFCETYTWTVKEKQNLNFRWLPVARPLEGLIVKLLIIEKKQIDGSERTEKKGKEGNFS